MLAGFLKRIYACISLTIRSRTTPIPRRAHHKRKGKCNYSVARSLIPRSSFLEPIFASTIEAVFAIVLQKVFFAFEVTFVENTLHSIIDESASIEIKYSIKNVFGYCF